MGQGGEQGRENVCVCVAPCHPHSRQHHKPDHKQRERNTKGVELPTRRPVHLGLLPPLLHRKLAGLRRLRLPLPRLVLLPPPHRRPLLRSLTVLLRNLARRQRRRARRSSSSSTGLPASRAQTPHHGLPRSLHVLQHLLQACHTLLHGMLAQTLRLLRRRLAASLQALLCGHLLLKHPVGDLDLLRVYFLILLLRLVVTAAAAAAHTHRQQRIQRPPPRLRRLPLPVLLPLRTERVLHGLAQPHRGRLVPVALVVPFAEACERHEVLAVPLRQAQHACLCRRLEVRTDARVPAVVVRAADAQVLLQEELRVGDVHGPVRLHVEQVQGVRQLPVPRRHRTACGALRVRRLVLLHPALELQPEVLLEPRILTLLRSLFVFLVLPQHEGRLVACVVAQALRLDVASLVVRLRRGLLHGRVQVLRQVNVRDPEVLVPVVVLVAPLNQPSLRLPSAGNLHHRLRSHPRLRTCRLRRRHPLNPLHLPAAGDLNGRQLLLLGLDLPQPRLNLRVAPGLHHPLQQRVLIVPVALLDRHPRPRQRHADGGQPRHRVPRLHHHLLRLHPQLLTLPPRRLLLLPPRPLLALRLPRQLRLLLAPRPLLRLPRTPLRLELLAHLLLQRTLSRLLLLLARRHLRAPRLGRRRLPLLLSLPHPRSLARLRFRGLPRRRLRDVLRRERLQQRRRTRVRRGSGRREQRTQHGPVRHGGGAPGGDASAEVGHDVEAEGAEGGGVVAADPCRLQPLPERDHRLQHGVGHLRRLPSRLARRAQRTHDAQGWIDVGSVGCRKEAAQLLVELRVRRHGHCLAARCLQRAGHHAEHVCAHACRREALGESARAVLAQSRHHWRDTLRDAGGHFGGGGGVRRRRRGQRRPQRKEVDGVDGVCLRDLLRGGKKVRAALGEKRGGRVHRVCRACGAPLLLLPTVVAVEQRHHLRRRSGEKRVDRALAVRVRRAPRGDEQRSRPLVRRQHAVVPRHGFDVDAQTLLGSRRRRPVAAESVRQQRPQQLRQLLGCGVHGARRCRCVQQPREAGGVGCRGAVEQGRSVGSVGGGRCFRRRRRAVVAACLRRSSSRSLLCALLLLVASSAGGSGGVAAASAGGVRFRCRLGVRGGGDSKGERL
eukprot:Rhum_TRINITY_DN14529_c5_g1::Rhum_TRINITY_DN14529_c5_g1_i1::g.96824::m.96824